MQLNDHEFRAALRGLVAKGIVTITGDAVALTPLGYQRIAEEAGWSRDVDDEDVPCFVNDRGYHEFSYVETWEALCLQQRLVALRSVLQ